MLDWIARVHILWLLVALFVFHGFLYSALGTDDWLGVALTATIVDTAVVAALKYFVVGRVRARGK
ncbi:MAG TPA: hypothetical protein VMS09_00485 [Paenibacillus sp.]|uniref:hypothetical protein n=1 Tax=Paenibacillus sp. TaxID=58172 RepID=UPI0028D7CCF7|nr:hypothetical protein [Paenibacillus sp.]HUC90484.1 hypothetical protein [Paenibacillus sp.]